MKHDIDGQSILILKSLADPIRLSITKFVSSHDEPVASCDVVKSCARRLDLTQPAMSHHFKKLVEAEVLNLEKRGTENYYEINSDLMKRRGINLKKL